MDKLRQAAEQALKRLDMYFVEHGNDDDFESTQALRQALAETDHFRDATKKIEPMAWMKPSGLVSPYKHGSYQIPLYTAPPKKEWVGLTDEERHDVLEDATGDGGHVYYDTLFRTIEAKLKQKNEPA